MNKLLNILTDVIDTPTDTTETHFSDKNLSTPQFDWQTFGIIAGVVVGVAILVVAIILIVKFTKKKKPTSEN